MRQRTCKSLPVLMHHYINNSANSITVSPSVFEKHCQAMTEHGWRGVSLAEAEAFFMGEAPLAERSALLTFDDGYLDNYFYALPILHKYGHQGAVFAVSDRLESNKQARCSLEQILSGHAPNLTCLHQPVQSDPLGFLTRHDIFCNHAEIRLMHQSGILAVAGHSNAHLGVYINDSFKEVVKPSRQLRTFYLTQEGLIWGMPRFPIKPGLAHRAFKPAPELIEAIKQLVPQNKQEAHAFFSQEKNNQALERVLRNFSGKLGKFETDAQMKERMWEEIAEGKKKLEQILGQTIRTLCWPWGACNKIARQLALEAGYQILLSTKEGPNRFGRSLAVKRFKVKSQPASWLLARLHIYSSPLLGSAYAKIRL